MWSWGVVLNRKQQCALPTLNYFIIPWTSQCSISKYSFPAEATAVLHVAWSSQLYQPCVSGTIKNCPPGQPISWHTLSPELLITELGIWICPSLLK